MALIPSFLVLFLVLLLWSQFCNALFLPEGGVSRNQAHNLLGDPPITHVVSFQVTEMEIDIDNQRFNNKPLGSLTIGLFGTTVPKTVNNFLHLCNMTYGFGYENAKFHRIIHDFMVQGGDFVNGDGTGGYSVYGKQKFNDENFKINHNKKGRVSMANSGRDTNGGQFFIVTGHDANWLNGYHVGFGQVIDGFDTLEAMNEMRTTEHDNPVNSIMINQIEIATLFDISSIFDASDVTLSPAEQVAGPSHGYNYFISFMLMIGVILIVKRVYFRRQYITDIKDSNYY